MDNFHCLACSATYGSRKQLTAHTSQCALNSALTDQVFDRKRKSEKQKRKEKRARRHESPVRANDPDIPEDPMVIDEQEELEYVDVRICSYSCVMLIFLLGRNGSGAFRNASTNCVPALQTGNSYARSFRRLLTWDCDSPCPYATHKPSATWA